MNIGNSLINMNSGISQWILLVDIEYYIFSLPLIATQLLFKELS